MLNHLIGRFAIVMFVNGTEKEVTIVGYNKGYFRVCDNDCNVFFHPVASTIVSEAVA